MIVDERYILVMIVTNIKVAFKVLEKWKNNISMLFQK